jgi:hypothetical protein
VTTKRKAPSRRLALTATSGAALSVDLSFVEWATGRDDLRTIAAALGRGHYLRALTKTGRFVLLDLRHIGEHDQANLKAWARRYALPYGEDSWALAWAKQTIRRSGARYWCPPIDDVAGAQIAEVAPRRRTNQEIAYAAPLVHDSAFRWVAAFQLGESYSELAKWDGSTASNIRRECGKLASLIGLPLRPTRRGHPQKKQRHAPTE